MMKLQAVLPISYIYLSLAFQNKQKKEYTVHEKTNYKKTKFSFMENLKKS